MKAKFLLAAILAVASLSAFADNTNVLTTGVKNLTPAPAISTSAPVTQSKVTLFSELDNVAGHKVEHRWETIENGQVILHDDITLLPTTKRYRFWTTKTLFKQGQWQVQVVDNGKVVSTVRFTH